ncbi:MAG: nucleotidyltransferase substrate binding protein [Gammaproteobacteria bacterium]|nr:nucleotidyltransferase substrate binding protein [Gammaproteobacteria bacterium]MDE0252717.1 nucleotidyltransferase substrate binding protein [Gammaproteobacteria bacterium]MDE0402405.1 nucleotidyltransferase substrate binding protein [Gammaproteobacteria bacterium]
MKRVVSCIKKFEVVIEQCGKLMRKLLAPYLSSNKKADSLTFKDLFRQGNRSGLMDVGTTERWLGYRDLRNDTAHEYGEKFAENTLKQLPLFIENAKLLADTIERSNDA